MTEPIVVDLAWLQSRIARSTSRIPKQRNPDGRRRCYFDADPCVYCGNVPARPSTEHVIAKSHGGASGWENKVCACYRCNTRRSSWPLLLWLKAIQETGSTKAAVKQLAAQFGDCSKVPVVQRTRITVYETVDSGSNPLGNAIGR